MLVYLDINTRQMAKTISKFRKTFQIPGNAGSTAGFF